MKLSTLRIPRAHLGRSLLFAPILAVGQADKPTAFVRRVTLACTVLALALAPVAAAPADYIVLNFGAATNAFYPSGVVRGADGALYGTTQYGGTTGNGTVFKVNADGSDFTVLHSFDYPGNPVAKLMLGLDGAFYGASAGDIFKLNPDGSGFAVLHSFDYIEGGSTALVQGADGTLYGATRGGYDYGKLFKMNPDGSGYTVLKEFDSGADGGFITGALTMDNAGALYGATQSGGATNEGTLFKMNPDGSGFAVLKNLDRAGSGLVSVSEGLMQASDGKLYGVAVTGGSNDQGTVFRLNPDGSDFTVIKNFSFAEGAQPRGSLIQGADGALYGTTSYGGSTDAAFGTVYRINPDGSGFTILLNFEDPNRPIYQESALVQGPDGALYGTTRNGGTGFYGYGTLFRVTLGPPPAPDLQVVSLTATNNRAPQGHKVTLTAVVTNAGTVAAGESTTIFMDGTMVLGGVVTPALEPGASATVSVDMRTASENGTHSLLASADFGAVVTESDESNNTRTVVVTIQGNRVR